ncbi:MAG: cell division protein FtsZ [Sphingobacteriales bacterium]|nr:cell division protein FtsZ [Sphingobacteriales bacterium]MBI3718206.1 cell division protein FtsZ [Sphingobacteriales bacterium]
MIHFDLPKEKSSIIKVIGVGGGGSNAVNHMFSQSIEGVNFIICNTDAQAIATSKVPNKVQLGPHLTQGLGAGANPDIGRQATEESLEEIKRILEVNTKMAFITAGMGGGTGTGGAPIIAKICKDLGILTVGIVTTPFGYEGKRRLQQAQDGINSLKNYVDTLLVISNDKLRHQFGNLKMKEAFAKADDVLATAAKCITDVINSTGQINVDFADVCTVMKNGGVAILGNAAANGENRAQSAIEQALNSPLLNDNDIKGAKWILININSSEGEHEFTMDEVEIIQNYILSQAGDDTDVILGMGYDSTLGDHIGITLIATGFHHKDPFNKEKPKVAEKKEEKIVMQLSMPAPEEKKAAIQQPVLFEEPKAIIKEEAPVVKAEEPKVEVKEELPEALVPQLVEVKTETPVVQFMPLIEEVKEEVPVTEETTPIHFELKPVVEEMPVAKKEEPVINKEIKTTEEPSVKVTSGGYLARPVNIYAEEKTEEIQSNAHSPVEPEPFKLHIVNQEEDTPADMQLVVKTNPQAAEEPVARQTIHLSSSEGLPIQDEAEEQRRKAAERLQKLRNLSFNINAADPNNEFDNVPAYLRRNMELYNTINTVENFYSNYTVKTDENNKTEISTVNTFLDGKKPD